MPRLLLFHLLGVWLLLNQLPSELSAKQSDTVRLHARGLFPFRMKMHSRINWRNSPIRSKTSLLSPGHVSSSIKKGAKVLNRLSEAISNVQDVVTANDELRKIILKGQTEAEDNSPSETKSLSLDQHSQKKRMQSIALSNKVVTKVVPWKNLEEHPEMS